MLLLSQWGTAAVFPLNPLLAGMRQDFGIGHADGRAVGVGVDGLDSVAVEGG